jgi:MOSC domain-containing protein YiiM
VEADHVALTALEDGLGDVRASPATAGTVELIVRRPAEDEREVVEHARLDPHDGLVGDTWRERGSKATGDGSPHPDMQLTLMNARSARLVARERERWPLAGDQLYVDLDISEDNLPAGTRLTIGTATIEISVEPHTGCAKFAERFGTEAARFVNTPECRKLRVRGLNARVVTPGTISVGDPITKA